MRGPVSYRTSLRDYDGGGAKEEAGAGQEDEFDEEKEEETRRVAFLFDFDSSSWTRPNFQNLQFCAVLSVTSLRDNDGGGAKEEAGAAQEEEFDEEKEEEEIRRVTFLFDFH